MNIFEQDIILEDERVLLRPLQENDFDHLLPFSLQEPGIWKYGYITAAGKENLRKYINDAVISREEKKEYPFIVFDKKAKSYAGSTRFYDIQQQWQTTQLGYTWYGKDFQRTGLNRHCKLLLLGFAFEKWVMERVEFRADANNERSITAMKAIGCIEEGILRSHMVTVHGTRRSSIVLSILREEWLNKVKSLIKAKMDHAPGNFPG